RATDDADRERDHADNNSHAEQFPASSQPPRPGRRPLERRESVIWRLRSWSVTLRRVLRHWLILTGACPPSLLALRRSTPRQQTVWQGPGCAGASAPRGGQRRCAPRDSVGRNTAG